MTKIDATGTRRPIQILGVDAGMMALSTYRFPDDAHYDSICDRLHHNHEAFATDSLVVSSSGLGDGSYDLVYVLDEAGKVKGIEVVFVTLAIDALVEARTADTRPTEEEYKLAFTREADTATFDAKQAAKDKVDLHFAHCSSVNAELTEKMLPTLEPEGDPKVVGTVGCRNGHVSAGDPCYGSPSWTGELPNGSYLAVVWKVKLDAWGERVSRLGLYRTR